MLLGFFSLDVEAVSFYIVPFEAGRKYQFVEIAPGATGIIFAFRNWGQDFRAFIERVGFGPDTLPFGDVLFLWEIDGETIERFNYQLASVKKPKQFDEPYIARREIVWRGINNDVNPHIFEVLCDGKLVMTPKARVSYNV